MRHYLLLLASFIFCLPLFSQNTNKDLELKQIIQDKGQAEVQFIERDLEQFKILTRQISIDDYRNGLITAFLSHRQVDQFLEHGYNYNIVQNRATNALTVATTVADMANWDQYPSYDVHMEMMQSYATDYPDICVLDTIGYSQEGRLIVVLKITDNPHVDEFEPEFFYSGQMHGDEIVSSILFLRLIDYLLTGYGNNAEVTNLVDNIEIWINPLANPDGCFNGGNNNVSNASRYAANGVDLNRNFPNPHPDHGEHPDGNQWAQETIDMMAFCQSRDFVMSANAHSGAEVVNYPWDSWTSSEKVTADDSWWQMVSKEYADTCQANSPSDYLTDVTSSGYTNGADWYYAFGSRQDWVNYYTHCREVTLEWSSNKLLDAEELPDHWIYNKDAMINYLKQVQYGINGIVTDACTGNPIRAKIEIDNHDVDNSHVYSSLPVGNFHRPILAGTYDVTISADGYQSQTFSNISVSNYATTSLNASLNPLTPVADFTFEQASPCLADYNLINITPGDVTFTWTFPDNSESTETNPSISFSSNGTYTISLEASNCAGNHTVNHDIIVSHLLDVPTASNQEICGPGDVTFSATSAGGGDINWYDAENGNLLSTGASYTTNISSDLTVWVEEAGTMVSTYGAKTDNSGQGGYYTSNNEHSLIFNCYEEVTLKSVKVYADGAGSRQITLKDQSGSVIYQESFSIPDGESRVTLNWDLPVANSLYLQGPGSPDLFRNGSNFSPDLSYPFEIDTYISIFDNTADDLGYYYYFYDWEVERTSCASPMAPVTASILPIATSDFSHVASGSEVQFTNNSTDADSYLWDFGNGDTSTEEHPLYDYPADGTYTVTLTATNPCGDVVSTETVNISTVNILENSSLAFEVFPNPVQKVLNIQMIKTGLTELEIVDMNGKSILTSLHKDAQNIQLNIEALPSGIYYLRIVQGEGIGIQKFVKE